MTNTYEIPFEKAESIKRLVGKTLVLKNGRCVNITRWEGQNYIITDPSTGKEGKYPAVYILQEVELKHFSIK